MPTEKYGILDQDIKNTLVKNRKFHLSPLENKQTVSDRIRILEEKLMSQTLTLQEANDIRKDIKRLKENYHL